MVALPVLLPPFQKLARRSAKGRAGVILIFGLLAFLVSLGPITAMGAAGHYAVGEQRLVATVGSADVRENRTPVIVELGLRRLVPPSLRAGCYASRETVCRQADVVVLMSQEAWGWDTYWTVLGVAVFSALISAALAWVLTNR
jgi:hypothetical protein